ncbi:hypothetical protein ABZV58_20070 [Nocardia sp. NPDC004654]|uniref:hypothetical protein n=1 Tax=Nocardia sp. NPDC004654 TaxID=3154776 RepID=UPI00339DBD70
MQELSRADEMTGDDVELPVFQQHQIPEAILALATIPDPDYIDLFTLVTGDAGDWSPEQWARAAFGDVAGLQGQFIWRVLLGIRLAWRRSPDHVAGWRIAARGDNWITLAAPSWMLTGNLVVHIDGEHLSLATIIDYDRPIAERIWGRLSAVHRSLAPGLLRDAHAAVRAKPRRRTAR